MLYKHYEGGYGQCDSITYLHFMLYKGNNFVSDGHVCNTFCPVLQKLVDVGLKTF